MTLSRRPSNQHRPSVSRPGPRGLRFGMFAVCVVRDSDPGLNKGKAKPLYQLLVSYSDVTTRSTDQGYPYRSALADCLDCTKDTIDNATKYLEREIGLIRVERRKVEGKPDENDANLYKVYDQWLIQGCEPTPDTPPQLVARYGPTIPGFDVDAWIAEHAPSFDLAAWRAAYEATLMEQEAKRAAQRQKESKRRKARKTGGSGTDSATPEGAETGGGGGTDSATGGGTDSATGGGMSAALSRAGSSNPASADDEAPSGRSPGEPRRASTGSKEPSAGGFAAPATDSSAPQTEESKGAGQKRAPKLTAKERAQSAEVLKLLPQDLRAALGDVIPTTVARSIVQSLAPGEDRERTPEQLVAHRLLPRWNRYWASKFYAGELTPEVNGKKRKPFGPLLEMLKDRPECSNLACEDRYDFVIGAECTSCAMRNEDKKADREREAREANADAGRQARRDDAHKAAEADTAPAEDAPAAGVPAPRESIVLHTPRPRRECAEDSCALRLPDDWDDVLCKKCRTRADRAAELQRQHQQVAARYEAPDAEFASAGPPPF